MVLIIVLNDDIHLNYNEYSLSINYVIYLNYMILIKYLNDVTIIKLT